MQITQFKCGECTGLYDITQWSLLETDSGEKICDDCAESKFWNTHDGRED